MLRRYRGIERRLAELERQRPPPPGPPAPDLMRWFCRELLWLEVALSSGGITEATAIAIAIIEERAAARRGLTRLEEHELSCEDERLHSRQVRVFTHPDRPVSEGQIAFHGPHHVTEYDHPTTAGVFYSLWDAERLLRWAVEITPPPAGPVWSPFARRRWAAP